MRNDLLAALGGGLLGGEDHIVSLGFRLTHILLIGLLDGRRFGFRGFGVGNLLVGGLAALVQHGLDFIQEEDLDDKQLDKQVANLCNQSYGVYRHQ